jgi:hypothetical protein
MNCGKECEAASGTKAQPPARRDEARPRQFGLAAALAGLISLATPTLAYGHPAGTNQPQSTAQVGDAGAPAESGAAAEPEPMAEPAPMPMPAPVARPVRPPMVPYADAGQSVEEQTNRNGVGFALGMHSGFGFAYRRYMGNTMLQGALFAMVTNRGDDATVWGGLSVAQYLLAWHASALRLVGGASYLYDRTTSTEFLDVPNDPTCVNTNTQSCPSTSKDVQVFTKTKFVSAGVGIGFEFGAIMRPGFSLSLDLVLTAMFSQDGLEQIWPLPALTMIYSW